MCLRYLNIFIYIFIYLFSVCCNQALEFNQIYLYSVINIYNCNFKIHLYKSQCKRIYYIILNVNYVHTFVRPALTKGENTLNNNKVSFESFTLF